MPKQASRQSSGALAGSVALVAGATRGAGRGVARALADAGALVYCTGRSVKGRRSSYQRPETIDETARMISDAGGHAVAVRVDHSVESQVKSLFARIMRAHGRLDIVVDSVAGEHPLMKPPALVWEADLTQAETVFKQALTSHLITAKHAAQAMMPARRGLIVEVTENDILGLGANPMSYVVKTAQKTLPLQWAAELKPHGVAVVSVTPGFLRSESVLEHFGVTEASWSDAGAKDSNFLVSESPLYVGRAIAALAADPDVLERSGMLYGSWELARAYRVTDYDGRRPDWGRHAIDWSGMPSEWIELFRAGTDMEMRWHRQLQARAKAFSAKIPRPGRSTARAGASASTRH